MRALTPVAVFAVSLFVATSASADNGAAPPPAAPPRFSAPPPYWMPIAPATERRSNTLRATGVVLFTLGAVTTLVGVVLFTSVATSECSDDGTGRRPCSISSGLGLIIAGAGAVTAMVGVPLFVIGSKQVPARTTTGKLVPELTVGAGSGSLRWSF